MAALVTGAGAPSAIKSIANAGGLFAAADGFRAAAGGASGAARLAIDLAVREGMGGRGLAMAGGDTGIAIRDISRIVATYGGDEADWAKMGADGGRTVLDGVNGQIHWYENLINGAKVEGKFKI